MKSNEIVVSQVKKTFSHGAQSVSILRGIDALFISGTSYAIVGVSGSGKSSLLHIISGFDNPSDGTIFFNNKAIQLFSVKEKEYYMQKVIGFLFQKPYLIKELSVVENIMLPAQVAGYSSSFAYKRACELLEVVGLITYKNYKPGILSGGQQQRVSLARALCNKPLFLCADEPTASLDEQNRNEVVSLIQYGMSAWDMGVIVCTHDTKVAHAMQHQFVLENGVLHSVTN